MIEIKNVYHITQVDEHRRVYILLNDSGEEIKLLIILSEFELSQSNKIITLLQKIKRYKRLEDLKILLEFLSETKFFPDYAKKVLDKIS